VRPARAALLAALGMLAAATGSAGPAVAGVRVSAHQFQHADLDGWSELPVTGRRDDTETALVVAGHRHATGALLAITRMNVSNQRAWRQDDGFFAEVEAGVERASPGYDRFHRKQHRAGSVPVLDLAFRQRTARGREVVLMRFLFFRRYTVVFALRAPASAYRRHDRTWRALHESFTPTSGT
jgi:hypothetical protein